MTETTDIPAGWRVRAARALRNVSLDELADRIGEPGLGARTLRKIEGTEREVRAMELRTIAAALDLPYEFFTADFWDLADDRVVEAPLPVSDIQSLLEVEIQERTNAFFEVQSARSEEDRQKHEAHLAAMQSEMQDRLDELRADWREYRRTSLLAQFITALEQLEARKGEHESISALVESLRNKGEMDYADEAQTARERTAQNVAEAYRRVEELNADLDRLGDAAPADLPLDERAKALLARIEQTGKTTREALERLGESPSGAPGGPQRRG